MLTGGTYVGFAACLTRVQAPQQARISLVHPGGRRLLMPKVGCWDHAHRGADPRTGSKRPTPGAWRSRVVLASMPLDDRNHLPPHGPTRGYTPGSCEVGAGLLVYQWAVSEKAIARRAAQGRVDRQKPGLRLPWGIVTTVLAIVALASLGTLAVVAGIKDADALATVALALAVLSFGAQLVVTLVQGQQASQVNSETKAALAEMRATTASLLANQRDQFDKVLRAALRQAIPAAVQEVQGEGTDDSGDPASALDVNALAADLEDRVTARVREALASANRPRVRRATANRLDPAPRDQSLADLLNTPPVRGRRASHC
jgi:hypothetical protein